MSETRILAPPPLITAAGLALGFVAGLWRAPPSMGPRITMFVVGVALFLAGVALASWALAEFRRAGTTPNPYGGTTHVVPSGPYRYTRNPMYVGMIVSAAGVAVAADHAWMLLAVPAVALALHFGVVRREEAYLLRKFGEDYEAYRSRVPRWL